MNRLLPPGILEAVLFLLVIAAFAFVWRAVGRRARIAAAAKIAAAPADALPDVPTDVRVRAIVRRLFRDPAQAAWVVEAAIGRRKFTWAATDFDAERYQNLLNKPADFAVFGLATLAPGGAEAMKDRIQDYDKLEGQAGQIVRLVPAGQFTNDYAVIGRVTAAARDETLPGGVPVVVYRTQVARQDDLTLMLDLAAEADPNAPRFADGQMVHGSARLYGRLAAD